MEKYSSYKDSGEKWLGMIPEHWEVKRLGSYFLERRSKVSDKDYAPLSVTKNGILPQLENVAKSNDSDNRKLVCAGDFVINSRSDRKGSSGVSPLDGSVSLINIVLEPRGKNLLADYCNYLLKSYAFIEEYYRNGRGIVADLWTTRYDEMKSIKLAMPPLPEQRAIVEYLDRVTSDIDRAIEQSQRMIDLLNERKQIIIQHAVTKGLNPNDKLKDSGVEWIGDVPEGWECLSIRRVVEVNPTRKKKLTSDTIVGYAPMECIRNDNMQPQTSLVSRLSTGLTYCETNDIVLAKVTPCFENGNVAIVPQVENDCCFASSEIFVYRCSDKIEKRFLLYYFQNKGFIDAGASTMQGTGGLKRVTTEFAKNAFVTLPDLSEQKEIVEYLDDYTTQIKSAIATTERKITLLRERKQIIINEVVTGKVKVS